MYQRILAPIDGSEAAQRAFTFALALARDVDAELIPLFVIDVPIMIYQAPGFDPSIVRDALQKEGEQLKTEAQALTQRDNVRGTPRVVESDEPGGDVAERILEEARAAACDLIVMGTHGRRGVKRLVLGSVAERLVRMSCYPVLLIPSGVGAIAQTHTAIAAK
jgi:nucleotide-binding universal stress UspA family protein